MSAVSERVGIAIVRHQEQGAGMFVRVLQHVVEGGKRQHVETLAQRARDGDEILAPVMVVLQARIVELFLDAMEEHRGRPRERQDSGLRHMPRRLPKRAAAETGHGMLTGVMPEGSARSVCEMINCALRR